MGNSSALPTFTSPPVQQLTVGGVSTTDVIAALALLVSLAAIFLAYGSYRGTLRASVRPVLIFSRTPTSWWKVRNVGSGPAIEVTVGNRQDDGSVENATKCYPLAAGEGFDLPWVSGGGLTVVYADLFGNAFTTTWDGNMNAVRSVRSRPRLEVAEQQWIQQVLAEGPDGSPISESDLLGKSAFELDVMRNEPYARRGYIFKRSDLQDHFLKQPGYKALTPDEGLVYSQMSQRERYESHFILAYQMRTGLSLSPQILRMQARPGDVPRKSEGED
jgi:hypothetical protein